MNKTLNYYSFKISLSLSLSLLLYNFIFGSSLPSIASPIKYLLVFVSISISCHVTKAQCNIIQGHQSQTNKQKNRGQNPLVIRRMRGTTSNQINKILFLLVIIATRSLFKKIILKRYCNLSNIKGYIIKTLACILCAC